MALLQISEPGESAQPHQHKLAVGIDLGTTNSLVATVRSGVADTLPCKGGSHLLPSVVHYGDQSVLVGAQAREYAAQDPHNTIISVKRLMGRGVKDLRSLGGVMPYEFSAGEGMPFIRTRQGDRSPVEVSAEILRVLAERGRETLGGDLVGAVITVPAYFDEAQRQATKDAAKLAGLNVLRLLNEPTAAAVAYGLDNDEEGVVAIYDLGGGTFDISILRLTRGVFEVLATGGDSALGGDDFDHAIASWILQQAGVDETTLNAATQRQVLNEACRAKLALSDATRVGVAFGDWSGELEREQFNALVDPLIDQTLRACKRALRDARVSADEVRNLVMVGGSTRVPRVRERVAQWIGKQPLIDIDPDRVVAIGAARQADLLAGNKSTDDMLLLDVIPLSLGLETMGGLMEKVIHRNTTIPVARAQEFTTFKDGQTAMAIHVLQGERELIADNRSLARFVLQGIPPMAAGAARIRVTFQVDADGLLNVSATELTSGVESGVQVKPSYGLSDGEIAGMLKASYSHAAEDRDARMLAEQQVEADRLLEALESALVADAELLSEVELQAIRADMAALKALREGDDRRAIELQVEHLSELTAEFAQRRMDSGIRKALAGHSIDEIES
ncbi:Fe-S protein assembly chaperone HscA [Aestuariirhabdus litorea]|uniref:Chaperone protein HscA homolog n=1 Tax=Aestuariirhabdus litorea TaxID=2528527 RepID=A0A3P3VM56_9GAMM|nr:Fe-S protein assembly chaperone HscA [Aestuariirhabdus litorea]RRJ83417.1 Fe-S protein assembly chaperone HscA [Aestuariirhabdus litorea]RWW93578.1 Fe-S protein assembly chaperone HscA [Endozoicomonadaceae bacterium GTF-13]